MKLIFCLLLFFSYCSGCFCAANNIFFEDLENFKNKSLNLKTEEQNLKAKSDLVVSKKLFWTPRLSVSIQQNKARFNSEKSVGNNSLSGNLSWNLFKGGADYYSLNEALAEEKNQDVNLKNESLNIETSSSKLIFKWLYLKEIELVQEQLLKLKEESLKIVKDQYRQGKLPLQEVTKSEVDLNLQKTKLRSSKLDILENKYFINSFFVESVKTTQWPFDESTQASLGDQSNAFSSEQNNWTIESRKAAWKTAQAMLWPSLDLEVSRKYSPLKDRTNKEWVAGITLSFALWNQWETKAQISSAYAEYLKSINDNQITNKNLKEKGLFLKQKVETARMNLQSAQNNLKLSRNLYQDILKSFRQGRLSINDLFQEQNRLLESENAKAFGELSFHQGLVELCALYEIKLVDCLE